MSGPTALNFDEILNFMLAHNGKVTNHELVQYFKGFLRDPNMRDEARNTFKKHVNALANIKNENNEKWLILKKKYMPYSAKSDDNRIKKPESNSINDDIPKALEPQYIPPPPLQLNQDFSILTDIIHSTKLATSPVSMHIDNMNTEQTTENSNTNDEHPPKVHPRRKSSDKTLTEKSSSISHVNITPMVTDEDRKLNDTPPPLTTSRSESMLVDSEQKISVKERKQMFNRMASEGDVIKSQKLPFNSSNADEEDRASLEQKETDPLDSMQKQWILCAARGEYHSLAKMCKENSKLARTKDPFTTAMHWACKRGDENLVKLLAGAHRNVINERSGYTPLHIAMQFRHENVYRLLVEVYDADPNVRDWAGKKPRQYLVRTDTSLSPGSYRKKEGFLRIGSLNVRVKKTTEAVSNFLGVGATRSSAYLPKSARDRDADRRSDEVDQLHKSWGSADNIPKEDKIMPPPMSSKVRRRGASGRRGVGTHSRSTPSTPDQPRAHIGVNQQGDSDSDTAAGFHSEWRQKRASHT